MTFDEVAASERPATGRSGWAPWTCGRAAASRCGWCRTACSPPWTESWSARAGGTVVVASHVTPIKVVVAEAIQSPLESLFRMELRPASVTVVTFFTPPEDAVPAEGQQQRYASLRQFNTLAPGVDLFDEATRW